MKTVNYEVVKMNVDADMQCAFTRAVAGHMFKDYDGALKMDGELGNKKVFDPRSYLALAETAITERVKRAASDLCASGKTMFAS
jgi:fructose-bisphosphate aldolase, class II